MKITRTIWIPALLFATANWAAAQVAPLQSASMQPIYNEFGQAVPSGALVQYLQENGQVYPPGVDGRPHANNPVVFTTKIGNGVRNHPSMVGRFSAALTPRPTQKIFARVFNAPTLEQASFYTDSQVFTPEQNFTIFYLNVSSTASPLDAADDDGDGLNNSWEKSLGSDPQNRDTDGDGVSDGDEYRAGTDLTDEDSYLAMVRVLPQPNGDLHVQWDSVPGKSYQLEFAAGDLTKPNVFTNVNSVVTAVGDRTSTIVTNGALDAIGIYRVRLVY